MEGIRKGPLFYPKWEIKRVMVWTSGRSLPVQDFVEYPPSPPTHTHTIRPRFLQKRGKCQHAVMQPGVDCGFFVSKDWPIVYHSKFISALLHVYFPPRLINIFSSNPLALMAFSTPTSSRDFDGTLAPVRQSRKRIYIKDKENYLVVCHRIATCKGTLIPRQSWILNSTPQIPDFRLTGFGQ